MDKKRIFYSPNESVIEFTPAIASEEEYRRFYSNQLFLIDGTPHLMDYVIHSRKYTSRKMLFIIDENKCANDLLYDTFRYPIFNISPDKLCLASPICVTEAYSMELFLKYFNYPEVLNYNDIVNIRDTFFGDFAFDNCELLGVYETGSDETSYEYHDSHRRHRTFNKEKLDSVFSWNYFVMLASPNGWDFTPNIEIESGMVRELKK